MPDVAALLDALRRRRSIGPRGLGPPGPSFDDLQCAAELALRAPDHQGLRPFRFVHVGREERAALGDRFEQAARAQGRDASGRAEARARADTGPVLLAVVARIRDDVPEVPPHEQWLCVGAAVMNLLNALHLMGHGAKVLGGSAARAEPVRSAFCHDGEQLACWVIAGCPLGEPAPSAVLPPRDLLTDWSPLSAGDSS
jgi:nitroreductase